MACLNIINCLPHISVCYKKHSSKSCLTNFNIFPLYNSFKVKLNLIIFEFRKSKYYTSALNGLNDFG